MSSRKNTNDTECSEIGTVEFLLGGIFIRSLIAGVGTAVGFLVLLLMYEITQGGACHG